jgi:hypothetical protein
MSRARNDRFVWTDDDFERGDDWLDRPVDAGETHGPASAVPFFTGTGWWRLFEPWHGAFSRSSCTFSWPMPRTPPGAAADVHTVGAFGPGI